MPEPCVFLVLVLFWLCDQNITCVLSISMKRIFFNFSKLKSFVLWSTMLTVRRHSLCVTFCVISSFFFSLFKERKILILNVVLSLLLTARSCVCVSLSPHALSYSCLAACLSDNPHTLPINKCVEVTLPVTPPTPLFIRMTVSLFVHLWVFCDWLLVSSTLNRDREADACSFSVSYCQLGWSHTQISRYRNEHPTLMPLSVSAPV